MYSVVSGDLAGSLSMREWVLLLSPLAATAYFLVYQDRFRELLAWLTIMIQ